MIKIMDGKATSNKILEEESIKISKLPFKPKLVVISVGDDQASKVYIRNKRRACDKVNIEFEEIHINNEGLSSEDLFEKLKTIVIELNNDLSVNGILIQKPIIGLDKDHEEELFLAINPAKDVDVFNLSNIIKIYQGKNELLPCTPKGILTLLDEYKINVEGKNVVIIGRSNIVGKPLSLALLNKNATVTICHSKTKDLKEITKNADILITAIGKPKMIDHSYITLKCKCIIDVGMNRDENNKLCGDCNFKDITNWWDFKDMINWWNSFQLNEKRYITPVPGGVGPMTVASLIQNVLQLCKKDKGE